MNYMWFSPKAQRLIPREKRAEWLKRVFEDGFDSYCRMMSGGSLPQRVAAWHVRMFVKHPSLRWAAELFFRCYFRLLSRHERSDGISTEVSR